MRREFSEKEAAKHLLSTGRWEKLKGFAIQTEGMNPNAYEEIFFEGKTLAKAIDDYFRPVTWWSYKPSDGEEVFEDIWDAVEYEEEREM